MINIKKKYKCFHIVFFQFIALSLILLVYLIACLPLVKDIYSKTNDEPAPNSFYFPVDYNAGRNTFMSNPVIYRDNILSIFSNNTLLMEINNSGSIYVKNDSYKEIADKLSYYMRLLNKQSCMKYYNLNEGMLK